MLNKKFVTVVATACLTVGSFYPSLASIKAVGLNESVTSKEEGYQLMDLAKDSDNVLTSPKETVDVNLLGDNERTVLFDDNWKIHLGDVDQGQDTNLDDSAWKVIDLPNDYSISQKVSESNEAESGFYPGGIQWYRKSFVLPQKYQDKQIVLEFDGAYMNTEVYLNGKKLGIHPNGYSPFAFDLTKDLICDGKTTNVLAVKTNNKIPSSRWYSGSGIYRDVHLTVSDKLHVAYNGVQATTPNLAQDQQNVTLNLQTKVQNDDQSTKTFSVKQELLDKNNQVVASQTSSSQSLEQQQTTTVAQNLKVTKPTLWQPDNPYLYTIKTTILQDQKPIDTYTTTYGFRYYKFDRETGFYLNGKKMKLQGVSMHHDQGALGAVANPSAIERQVKILKEMGANAIRSTHNPASPVLIQMANKYGMLVIDEAFDDWTAYKNGNVNDYSSHFNEKIGQDNQILNARPDMTWAEFDVKAMVDSAKNDPSVIMWSIGNEITEGTTGDTSNYPNIANNLITWIKQIDQSRPVTLGDNQLGNATLDQINDLITKAGGVVGKNYKKPAQLEEVRKQHPDWILYGSETASAIHSRGVYNTYGKNDKNLQMSEYDNDSAVVGWGDSASDAWKYVIENDWNAGEFVWTGFDYIGEPTPWNGISTGSVSQQGAKPKSSYFGIVDTAGFPKDTYYLYRSIWNHDSHTLSLMSTWNDNEIVKDKDGKVQVDVYTDAYKVELYLNGQKIGTQTATKHTTDAGYTYQTFDNGKPYPTFKVNWQAGTLSAKIYDEKGNDITKDAVGRKEVKTSSQATQLKATVDHTEITADGRALAYVSVDVLDKDGNFVSAADNRINFDVTGQGKLVGVDNGNPTDIDSYQATSRKAFNGKALAIVQATKQAGQINVEISADGLTKTKVSIQAKQPPQTTPVYIKSYELAKNYYLYPNAQLTLPETLTLNYSDGSSKQTAVIWDKYDQSQLGKVGSFTLQGQIEGTDVKPQITINVISPLVTVQNYSAMAVQSQQNLTLPTQLKSVDATGKPSVAVNVTWQTPTLDISQLGIQKVQGTANVYGKTYPVTASIRVVKPADNPKNIARLDNDKPKVTNGYQTTDGKIVDKQTTPISDSLDALTNGVTNNGTDTSQRWTNWSLKDDKSVAQTYVQFEWENDYPINNLKLYHFTDSAGSTLPGPQNIHFEYFDEATQKWEKIEASNITQVSYTSGDTPYGFIKPVTTKKLRIWVKNPAPGKSIGFTEVEVYPYVQQPQANSTATLASLKVNGQELLKTRQADLNFEVNTPDELAVTYQDDPQANSAVTVAKLDDKTTKVLVTSEDHQQTTTYTIVNKYQKPADNQPQNPGQGDSTTPTPDQPQLVGDKNPPKTPDNHFTVNKKATGKLPKTGQTNRPQAVILGVSLSLGAVVGWLLLRKKG